MKQINCSQHIVAAYSAIHLSLQSVKALFYDRELYEIYSIYKEEKDFLLEIPFDTATLTCLFDKNNICDCSFLFLNDPSDITYYIEHCNKMYHFKNNFSGWIVNNHLIQITTREEGYKLMILPCGGVAT